jgi:hypothetical protein
MTGDYVTRDNGLSWNMFNLREQIAAFAFDPINPRVIYAANAALWRSNDFGRTWKMVFPNPARNTVEHLIGDRANYSLTSSDPAYPGGDISVIAIKKIARRTMDTSIFLFSREVTPSLMRAKIFPIKL